MPSSSPAYFEHDPDFEEALLAVPTNVGRPAPAPLYTDAPYYAPTVRSRASPPAPLTLPGLW